MVIAAGGHEGSASNFHRGADQWLYVESGSGEAVVNGHHYKLQRGSLLLIQRGDKHEIRNSGRIPLKTLNFYLPPAYRADGDDLPWKAHLAEICLRLPLGRGGLALGVHSDS